MPDIAKAEDAGAAVETIRGYSVHVVWNSLGPKRRDELVRFWLDHRAIPSVEEAQRRTQEVVCLALDPQDRIAGVSTVYVGPFGPGKKPYWFYRTFVRPDCRVPGLAIRLLRTTLRCLARLATEQAGLPKGMVIITENRRLTHPGWHRKIAAEGMQRLGTTPDGMDVWRRDF
jgi:hypothetical protein